MNDNNNHICTDLIPAIVSWTPIDSLRDLSRASVIFAKVIYESDIRVYYHKNNPYVLDDKILFEIPRYKPMRLGSRTIKFLSNGFKMDYVNVIVTDTIIDPIDFTETECHIDHKRMIVIIYHYNLDKFSIVNFTKLVRENDTYTITINDIEYTIPSEYVTNSSVSNQCSANGDIYVDTNSGYFISFTGDISFTRMKIIYDGSEFVKK